MDTRGGWAPADMIWPPSKEIKTSMYRGTMNWIPTTEKLPTDGNAVLITYAIKEKDSIEIGVGIGYCKFHGETGARIWMIVQINPSEALNSAPFVEYEKILIVGSDIDRYQVIAWQLLEPYK